jgi:hypothetical protein
MIKSMMMRWAGPITWMGEIIKWPRIMIGRPGNTLEDDIKMGHKENVDDVCWIYMAQDRDQWWAAVSTIMNFWVP